VNCEGRVEERRVTGVMLAVLPVLCPRVAHPPAVLPSLCRSPGRVGWSYNGGVTVRVISLVRWLGFGFNTDMLGLGLLGCLS
jgi:hypothetical protein